MTLDGNDVARLVECAIRHPTPNMRHAVLAAIWNHPDSFRQIFQFGLNAPPAFPEIRRIAWRGRMISGVLVDAFLIQFGCAAPSAFVALDRPTALHLAGRRIKSLG